MALWKDEKKEEVAARELPRRPTSRNKKKATAEDAKPSAAAITPPKRKSKRASRLNNEGPENGGGGRMNSSQEDQANDIVVSDIVHKQDREGKSKRASPRKTKIEEVQPKQDDEDLPKPGRIKSKKNSPDSEANIAPSPPLLPPASPPTIQDITQRSGKDIPKGTNKHNARFKAGPVEDSTIEEIVWFTMTIKDNSSRTIESEESEESDQEDSKKIKETETLPPPTPSPLAAKDAATRIKPKAKTAGACEQQTLNFLQSLEQANAARKQKDKKKKKKKPKLSILRRKDIQKKINKHKESKAKVKVGPFDDSTIEEIGWFTVEIKENSSRVIEPEESDNEESKKVNIKKEKKQLRSTVDYLREYPFSTRQQMEETPGYYLHMIGVKKRQFRIDNLFTRRPLQQVYSFDVKTLEDILDKKEDKWWIKSRLQSYQRQEEEEEEEHGCQDEDEMGMEALGIFFGPNEIDQDTEQDDNSIIFSIASVESVHFSDDDDNHDTYKGKRRESVEVMPGEFKLLRKEEETWDAIETGNCMSSLCLGCGVALVSVSDAREVACPTCGSITPLNGVCLHKPFGIATGIKQVKVEHLLGPRKSVFGASIEDTRGFPPAIITTNDAAGIREEDKRQQKTTRQPPSGKGARPKNFPKPSATDVPPSLITAGCVAETRREGTGQRKIKRRGWSGTGPNPRQASKSSASRRPANKNLSGKSRPEKPAVKPGAVRAAGRPPN